MSKRNISFDLNFDLSNPNKLNQEGWAAIHYAAAFGEADLASELIHRYADVNITTTDEYRLSPLLLAIKGGHVDIVNLLIHHRANPNIRGGDWAAPFWVAVKRPNFVLEMAESLVKAGADVSNFANDGMSQACRQLGHSDELSDALVKLVDTALAQRKEKTEIIMAALDYNKKVIEFFQDSSIPEEAKYITNLFVEAGHSNNMILMVDLIREGYDLNKPDYNGDCPIHYAIDEEKHDIMLMLLLSNGAIVDTRNANGKTASEIAIEKGLVTSLSLLMACGANPNSIDSNGISLLQKVIFAKDYVPEMFEILIKYLADIKDFSIEWIDYYTSIEVINCTNRAVIDQYKMVNPVSVELMQAAQMADSVFHGQFNILEFAKIKQQASDEFMQIFGTRLNALIKTTENYKATDLAPQLIKDITFAKNLLAVIDWKPNMVFESNLKYFQAMKAELTTVLAGAPQEQFKEADDPAETHTIGGTLLSGDHTENTEG